MSAPKVLSPPPEKNRQATVLPIIDDRLNIDVLRSKDYRQMIPNPMNVLAAIRDTIRPWSEFLNINNFKCIDRVDRLTPRVVRNFEYFHSNYSIVFLTLIFYCLVTSPLVILVLMIFGVISYRIYKQNAVVTVFGRELTVSQQLMATNLAAIPVLLLVGVGSIIMWALGASVSLIFAHAGFYNIDAIVTEDSEGFLTEVV